ncbi:MAG: xanthine dehydrogenase family protein molybdopterin-binding subunit [Betaproteobacteria bacterium]|nr:MAG: xanthine dehydrogenase family protein molybdopterin-binding subunit [Betaproteobacteria bacterium]
MNRRGIGQALERVEDPRLLRGEGRFLSDRRAAREAHLVLVRSPHAHARILRIETGAAAAAPGVLGVFTAEDLQRDGLRPTSVSLQRKRPDGQPMFWRAHPGLARERVRHVGDPVVAVVAESLAQARDAADQVVVDYEAHGAVTAAARAIAAGAAAVWEQCPDNVCNAFEIGERAATDAAFARAAHVVKGRYEISRVHAQFMEPRGALGEYDPADGRYTLHTDTQYVHRVREVLAGMVFGIPEHRIRVVAGDIGGAFGGKGWAHLEQRLVLWLARRLARPVRWCCERSEAPLADEHGRDCLSEAELALDAEGRFLALRVRNLSNLGAYVSCDRQLMPSFANLGSLVGVYAIPAAHVRVTGVFTHTNPIAPYRGNGRPEAIYVIERLIDDAARALGVDRIELRRRNLIAPAAMPYRTALTFTYDCGEFERNLERALSLADWAGFAARREEAARRGQWRGIGLANAIERAASPPGAEYAEIRFDPGGDATLLLGSKSQGQGHETVFRQIACERLGLDPATIRYEEGDTAAVTFGVGTFGSRSMALGGSALWRAAERIVAKGRCIAAHLLEANPADVAFGDGRFTIAGTDRGLSLKDVARAAFITAKLPAGMEPGLFERAAFAPVAETFPNGCHVCEVEIDPDTGVTRLVAYTVVDDVGTEVNPALVKGQVAGGVVQGLGQVLMERLAYDPESGQLLTASFMDYAMPRADDLCDLRIASHPVPTALNPLGVKGVGEAGAVGALGAAMNAIVDALAPAGVTAFDMPATSERVWRAIRAARPVAAR